MADTMAFLKAEKKAVSMAFLSADPMVAAMAGKLVVVMDDW